MAHELKEKYERELARLDAEEAHYEQQWTKTPRFALVLLTAPLAAIVWGWGAAAVAFLVSAALLGTRAYLIAMRKGEVRWMRERVHADLTGVESSSHQQAAPMRVSHS